MNPLLDSRRILACLTIGCASTASLSAQFITANAQEAQAYASGINQGHAAISSVSDFALMNLSAGAGFRGSYAYDRIDTDRDGFDRAFETEITQHSAHFGYVHQFEAIVAGINLSYIDSEADSDYRDTNTGEVNLEGDGWMISGGLAHSWENLTVSLIGGAGQLSLDGSRRSSSFPNDKTSSFDTDLYFVTADAHYRIVLSEKWVTAPFVQLKYLNVAMDGFVEKGANDPGKVDSTERDWITGELGLRTQLQVSDSLIASLVLSWEHDFDSSETEVSGVTQSGMGTAGGLDVPDVGENRFKAALGIDYVMNANWTLSGGASIATGDKYDAYGARAVLSYSF